MGVSFGGIVAIEISRLTKPQILILISSVASEKQLSKPLRLLGKSKLLNIIPNAFIKPPKFLLQFLFGAKHKLLLNEIIKDTKPSFIRWALNAMINWSNVSNEIVPIRIHGTKDKFIPLRGHALKIENGGHFMIVDNAKAISQLVNDEIDKLHV